MVTACLIASTANWSKASEVVPSPEETEGGEIYDNMDGPSEEEAYLQGETNPDSDTRCVVVADF